MSDILRGCLLTFFNFSKAIYYYRVDPVKWPKAQFVSEYFTGVDTKKGLV